MTLRSDVAMARQIEPDRFQGFADLPAVSANSPVGFGPDLLGEGGCLLSWAGNVAPLKMPGGSVQLAWFTLEEDWPFWRRHGKVGHEVNKPSRWMKARRLVKHSDHEAT